ncbi:AAA family ATPase [Haloplanus litoreus]|uniref:AAA family ATPase n=2 Tax=Haloplanus litoreus TaxID=767515 RepID=A0ABD5ZZI5_9EURY
MRIESLTISNFRGINGAFELEPENDNLVLVGPNGSGKSSVIAAVDFLLTGSIQALSGEGTQSITERRHGPHVDAAPEESWVEADFSVSGETLTIRRTVNDRDDPDIDGPDESTTDRFKSTVKAAERGLHLLSRDELLDFITAKGSTRSERIRTLLNLQHVRDRRLALDNAAENLDEEAERIEREARSRRSDLHNILGKDSEDEERTVLQIVNSLRAELGGGELASLDEESFTSNIESPSRRVVASSLLRSDGRQRLNQLQEWLSDDVEEFLTADEEYVEAWEEIDADEESRRALERRQLIEQGIEAIDPDAGRCPLCLEPWEPDRLEEHLEDRLQQASELQETLDQLGDRRDEAQQMLTDVRITADSLRDIVRGIDRFDESSLDDFLDTVEGWEEQYSGDPLSTPPKNDLSTSEKRSLLRPDDLEALLDRLSSHVEDGPQLDQLDETWQTLNAANRRYNEMIDRSRKAAEYRRIADDMSTVHQTFLDARDAILEEIYSQIEDRFEHYYTTMHGDESDLSVGLNPTETGLDIEVDFYERGQYPPHALHSEGHQDSMGICLYFALADWLQEQEELPIMMLDDVVMSIDAEHRRPLADLMGSELTEDYQLIVATHDDLWHRHLRSSGVVSSSNAIQLSGWDIEEGPQTHGRPEMEWDTIESELENGNTSIAAHQTRRMAEWYLREACDRLNAKVPFKSNSRWTLGDFQSGAISRYKELLRASKAAEQSWGGDTSHISELEDEATEVVDRIYEYGGAINPNVHYNEDESTFASCTPKELQPAVDAYRDFYELLWCDECGACVYISMDGQQEDSLRCNCGQLDLNLRKSS